MQIMAFTFFLTGMMFLFLSNIMPSSLRLCYIIIAMGQFTQAFIYAFLF